MPKRVKKNVHGSKGVYCGGEWLPIEDCGNWLNGVCNDNVSEHKGEEARQSSIETLDDSSMLYDVAIIGAGCIGSSIARELSKYDLNTILIERDDDVTQGATKGNSGIVHAGYDDIPGSMRSKFCWNGNQMFGQLDKELRFGYLKNGSIVVAKNEQGIDHLNELYERGIKNGVKNLRILEKDELHSMEPHLSKQYISGLHSPDAGTITPYEFTIALAENAAQNGVQIRTRHEVVGIECMNDESNGKHFSILIKEWPYSATSDIKNVSVDEAARRMFTMSNNNGNNKNILLFLLFGVICLFACMFVTFTMTNDIMITCIIGAIILISLYFVYQTFLTRDANTNGSVNHSKIVKSRYIINSGGLFADKIANMINDESFKILPRLGEYILLDKTQGHLANCTLFPVPSIMGKGVLCQTTLWGNLILGPTARDVHNPAMMSQSKEDILKFIFSKTKEMVPEMDASKTIHSFAGARAKSDRKDWIIEKSLKNDHFINVAGIDSPGLAGSPAIALYVVNMLKDASQIDKYFEMRENKLFEANRKPLIFPKRGWVGIKLKKYDVNGSKPSEEEMKKNVICKCEMVTEYEIVDALHRPGVHVDTTQAIRRRTRAGMGHCQASLDNINCERHVAAIIARENKMKLEKVGRRPWPATSLLKQRWLTDEEKEELNGLSV